MNYPTKVEVDGVVIPIDTNYKTALRCLDVCDDQSISNQERALAIIYLLCEVIPDVDLTKLLKKLQLFLQCGKTEQKHSGKKDMDFKQDEQFIYSSFIYDYGIDLEKEEMHWWKFIDLLNGLSSDCILSRVRDIRTMDISIYKDPKTKDRILKARAQVALKQKVVQTDEEKELENKFEKLFEKPGTNQLDEDDYFIE